MRLRRSSLRSNCILQRILWNRDACLANSIDYARNRVTFGRPLAQRQAIQWMLANLSIDLAHLHVA